MFGLKLITTKEYNRLKQLEKDYYKVDAARLRVISEIVKMHHMFDDFWERWMLTRDTRELNDEKLKLYNSFLCSVMEAEHD